MASRENRSDIAFVLPAHNEEGAVGRVVREIRKMYPDALIIVVDNASSDRTAEEAKRAGALVVKEPVKGLGRAVKAGIQCALEHGSRVILRTDSDGEFDPSCFAELIEAAEYHDLVIGNRFSGGRPENVPLSHYLFNMVLIALFWLLYGELLDVTCGCRAFSRELAMEILKRDVDDGPAFDADTTSLAVSLGYSVKSVDVRLRGRISGRRKVAPTVISKVLIGLRILLRVAINRIRWRYGTSLNPERRGWRQPR
ncbi:glycosyltransferase family 2 protein [Methanopyrus sp.]